MLLKKLLIIIVDGLAKSPSMPPMDGRSKTSSFITACFCEKKQNHIFGFSSEQKVRMTFYVIIIVGIIMVSYPVMTFAGILDSGQLSGISLRAESPDLSGVGQTGVGQTGAAQKTDKNEYLVGAGDVLYASVWKDAALTKSCVVRPDGIISFPLIGDITAANRTTAQIKAEMEKKLEKFVPGVILSLEVKQINSLIVYVIGKVKVPGRFVMNTNIDVIQILAIAGGLNEFAKRNKIKIFRQEEDATTIFPFEYDEVIEGRRLGQNIQLKRGDVVVIP